MKKLILIGVVAFLGACVHINSGKGGRNHRHPRHKQHHQAHQQQHQAEQGSRHDEMVQHERDHHGMHQ